MASVMMYYHVQNDRGESGSHPNACKLYPTQTGKVVLQDILNALNTLMTTSAFHVRVQVTIEKSPAYLDLMNAGDVVPLVNGNVIAKLLRLDNLRCASRLNTGLTLKSYIPNQAPLVSSSSTTTTTTTNTTPRAAGAGAGPSARTSSASSVTPAGPPPPPPASLYMPVMNTTTSLHTVPKEEDGETHIRDTGEGDDIYKKLKQTDANGMRPVKAVEDTGHVEVPVEVDADLADKSDYAKARIMARRNEVKKLQEARLAEVEHQMASEANDVAEKEAARAIHQAKIKEWALESGGKVKNIRNLLSTLQDVLWEGAKWEPVPMAKLIAPARVKGSFLRACTQVHPDKQGGLDASQKYIAEQVFHYIESAYREFQDKET